MEVLVLSGLAIRALKQQDKTRLSSLYCVIKAIDHHFCSKTRQLTHRDWIQLIGKKDTFQVQLIYAHNLFKLQIWNYDSQTKIGEINISNSDLPANEKEKQMALINKEIQIKIAYQRKYKQQSSQESERNTLKVSYNKSDPNLKISLKSGSTANLRKINSPMQQIQPFGKYDMNTLGRWKFIPARNETNPHKLRL